MSIIEQEDIEYYLMRSEGKITRENALEVIKNFAKEYRKELGKVPGEIIFVGGGSIETLLYNAENVEDVITRIKEKMKQ